MYCYHRVQGFFNFYNLRHVYGDEILKRIVEYKYINYIYIYPHTQNLSSSNNSSESVYYAKHTEVFLNFY